MGVFRFKQFSVKNESSALKVGTDGVLLGCLAGTGCKTHGRPFRVLDIGTGTGVVALMLAQRLCEAGIRAQILGIDIDEASAKEAAQNFADSPWPLALAARHCSLEQFLKDDHDKAGGAYSLIVSNPPFFDSSLQNPDARESAARHTLSLSYREICASAKILLDVGGELAVILPAEVEKELVRTAASFGLHLQRIVRIRTTERKPVKRIVASFVKGERPAELLEETLLLCDPASADGRTEEYRALLRPFLVSVE